MAQPDLFRIPPRPWNTGRMIGPKPPLKPKHIWAIRHHLKTAGRVRDLALFSVVGSASTSLQAGNTTFTRSMQPAGVRAEGDCGWLSPSCDFSGSF